MHIIINESHAFQIKWDEKNASVYSMVHTWRNVRKLTVSTKEAAILCESNYHNGKFYRLTFLHLKVTSPSAQTNSMPCMLFIVAAFLIMRLLLWLEPKKILSILLRLVLLLPLPLLVPFLPLALCMCSRVSLNCCFWYRYCCHFFFSSAAAVGFSFLPDLVASIPTDVELGCWSILSPHNFH